MLLDFDDIQDDSDEEVEVNKKGKEKVGDEDLSVTRRITWADSWEWEIKRNGPCRFGAGCFNKPWMARANETLPNFKERWVSESNAISNVPELMQISSFMRSHKCPELSKRISDNIPKTVDEMLKRVDDYLRSKETFRNTVLPKGEFQRKELPLGQ
uniref:Reverse transcriptase domain-containing protein n=1 Tax=Tanacetum cinerariifolium TaxID=118510 RepID=A0A6L2M4S3_TANCI|nr:reverse transcriptase domain-containing protein [Tanacetum cinerariifolium]